MVLNVVFIENNGSHFNLLVFTFRLHLVIDNVSLQHNEYNTNYLKGSIFLILLNYDAVQAVKQVLLCYLAVHWGGGKNVLWSTAELCEKWLFRLV